MVGLALSCLEVNTRSHRHGTVSRSLSELVHSYAQAKVSSGWLGTSFPPHPVPPQVHFGESLAAAVPALHAEPTARFLP